ncbi:MAG: hypothetical protein MJZ08_09035 [Bacteroidaceae bacterium]|nr:hypothetical protein [Bacteroidaceae bacterium]
MKKLTRLQSIIFLLGGIMLVAGAVLYMFEPVILAPAVFAAGALFYVVMQWMQTYEGNNITLIRLRKIQLLSGVFIMLSAVLMISNRWVYDIFTLFKIDIYNSWIIFLFIGVILQLYTILRIDNELKIE